MEPYRIDVLTLFPDMISACLHESIIGRAGKKGLVDIRAHQIRDYTLNKQRQVDDYPYGGGMGCVMMAQPLKSCLDQVLSTAQGRRSRVIYLSPQGSPFCQETAKRLRRDYDHLVLVCGHYEGVDERFIELCVDEELSLGDFVLTGGEIAAMAVADAVCRLVPGVLADEQCYTGESHWDGLLEYPQYTRPEVWEGLRVPQVLIEGDHARVARWRRSKQLERTRDKRPDMFSRLELTDPEDKKLMEKLIKHKDRPKLDKPVTCRKAEPGDIDAIMEIVAQARESLARYNVDQWQGEYPSRELFLEDMERGELYLLCHGEETAAVFLVSFRPEPSYDEITDGRWTQGLSYACLHRCAVSARYRGTDMARIMIDQAQELAAGLGAKSLRVDTHKKNKPMQELLRGKGFRYRGNVLADEPGHDPHRQAFEKILKKGDRQA